MTASPAKIKIVVLCGLFAATFSDGYITGQMASMVAAQQSGELALTDTQMSWIASSVHGMCIGGFALAALITEKFGPRRAVTMLSIPMVLHWILTYFADYAAILIASRVLLGLFFGGIMSLCILSTGEYTSPNERGMCIQIIFSLGAVLGLTTSHILGIMLQWRTVALLGVIPSGLTAILPYFWIESPPWLASKGRFEECEVAFRRLHGTGVEAEKELQLLMEVEKANQAKLYKESSRIVIRKIIAAVKCKYFCKIILLAIVLHVYRVATANLMIITYIITLVQGLPGDSSVYLAVLIVDGCIIISVMASCALRNKLKTRTLLLTGGTFSASLLIILSIHLYFQYDGTYYLWGTYSLLGLYIIVSNSSLNPVIESLFGEIYPLELKSYCLFGFGIFGGSLLFLQLMFSLHMFKLLNYYGVFFIHGVLSALCLLILWVYLPETKGRTLQEVELFFKNDKFDNIDDLLREQRKLVK